MRRLKESFNTKLDASARHNQNGTDRSARQKETTLQNLWRVTNLMPPPPMLTPRRFHRRFRCPVAALLAAAVTAATNSAAVDSVIRGIRAKRNGSAGMHMVVHTVVHTVVHKVRGVRQLRTCRPISVPSPALRHVALCCSAQTCTTKKRGVSCVQRQGMLRRGRVKRPPTGSQAGTHGTRGRLAGPHLTQSTPARLAS